MPDFKAALDLVLEYEGGKVDDPRDPGGRTAYGVTQTTFNAYCKGCGATPRDVFTITPAEVQAVYRNRYAAPIRFDELPDGVGFCVLDAAINSGPRKAVEWLQAALGVPVDGAIGPATLAAAKAGSAFVIINAMCDARLAFLRRLATWSTYAHGWSNRIESVRKNATAMAHKSPTPELDLIIHTIADRAVEAGVVPKPAKAPSVAPPAPVSSAYLSPVMVQHPAKPALTFWQRVAARFGRAA